MLVPTDRHHWSPRPYTACTCTPCRCAASCSGCSAIGARPAAHRLGRQRPALDWGVGRPHDRGRQHARRGRARDASARPMPTCSAIRTVTRRRPDSRSGNPTGTPDQDDSTHRIQALIDPDSPLERALWQLAARSKAELLANRTM